MADPERDFSIIYDDQSLIQILQSPFFDVDLEVDHTVNDYIDRILETVVLAVEDQLGTVEWRLAADPKDTNEINMRNSDCTKDRKNLTETLTEGTIRLAYEIDDISDGTVKGHNTRTRNLSANTIAGFGLDFSLPKKRITLVSSAPRRGLKTELLRGEAVPYNVHNRCKLPEPISLRVGLCQASAKICGAGTLLSSCAIDSTSLALAAASSTLVTARRAVTGVIVNVEAGRRSSLRRYCPWHILSPPCPLLAGCRENLTADGRNNAPGEEIV
ncbi:hypothetical protein M5K25_014723 [Dendrobium thyrsiflorum]|uniref:Uncharacterized protein n=1 Tax=Dendrobium thyrsiflorum TaxID=117978 RepID=A0ABD0UP08_DENTH